MNNADSIQSVEPVIRLSNVTFSYGARTILRDVSLDFAPGKVVAVMGGSGCGKTTILRLIGGQLKPNSGTVSVLGEDVNRLDMDGLYALRRRMGMMFQFGALFTDLNVFENVAFPLREHTGLPQHMIRDLVLMKLHAVGLRGAAGLRTSEVSGGMARRVAFARAIALDPEVILYDEPFAGLDPISLGITANLIRRLNDALGALSIVVTHDVTEAFKIADYVYMISDQKVAAEGTPEQLRDSEEPSVVQFLEGAPDGPVPFHYPARNLAEDFGLAR